MVGSSTLQKGGLLRVDPRIEEFVGTTDKEPPCEAARPSESREVQHLLVTSRSLLSLGGMLVWRIVVTRPGRESHLRDPAIWQE